MDLRCEQVLDRLGPLNEAGELSVLPPDVREHLESCTECQTYLRRDANLRRRVQALRSADSARSFPEHARAALTARLAEEGSTATFPAAKSRRFPAWAEAAFAAAAAVVLLAGGLSISQIIGQPLSDGAFVQDYLQAALPEITAGHLTATQVAAFYEEQFGDRMLPARLLDAPVTRVAVCEVEGRRGAMVEYDFEGERLVYYQVPLDGARASTDLRSGREGALNVARWGDDLSEHVLVSPLPAEQLQDLAKERMN
jgi:anti-sigma factor RsiW